jgi:hypothetical protein
MTVSEFKAWLDGFSAAINGAPSQEQWEAIKGKLSTITPALGVSRRSRLISHRLSPRRHGINRSAH